MVNQNRILRIKFIAVLLSVLFLMLGSMSSAYAQNVNCVNPGVTCTNLAPIFSSSCPSTFNQCYDAGNAQCINDPSGVWLTPRTSPEICSGDSYIDQNYCGNTRTISGTVQYTPATSAYCVNENFEQTRTCYSFSPDNAVYSPANETFNSNQSQNAVGTGEYGWYPSTDDYCTGEEFPQTSICLGTNGVPINRPDTSRGLGPGVGTMAPEWAPDPGLVCKETCDPGTGVCSPVLFDQESTNCFAASGIPLTRQNIPGTKDFSSVWTPETSQYCSGENYAQTGDCGHTRAATGSGTKTWDPDIAPEDVCQGESETVYSSCMMSTGDFDSLIVAGTDNGPSCCEDTTWDNQKSDYCYNQTFTRTSNCGTVETGVYGSDTGPSCCSFQYWKTLPQHVCNGVEYNPEDNCGNVSSTTKIGTKNWGTDVYGNTCGSADGECLPGLPCFKRKRFPINPFDGTNESNEADGPNAIKNTSALCDSDYMNQIHAKAFLEADREFTIFQTTLRKPDSVLEYSCFDNLVNTAAFWAPRSFSETKRWSAEDCQSDSVSLPETLIACDNLIPKLYEVEINGQINNEDYPPIELGVYMADGLAEGETRMGNNLKGLVMETLNAYLNEGENFSHPFLGGATAVDTALNNNSADGEITPKKLYICGAMNLSWNLAKCGNFAGDDQPLTLLEMSAFDPRLFPQRCEVEGRTQTRLDYLRLATNREDPTGEVETQRFFTYAHTDSSQYVTDLPTTRAYRDFLDADGCEDPIPTGLKVIVRDFTTDDPWGAFNTTLEEQNEYVCVNPGCYYDWEAKECKN